MRVISPVLVTDAVLTSSTVPETDFPAWAIGTTYAAGAKVIKTSTHRIYESLYDGNVGHDPADPGSLQWMDIGSTNRWAMFEEALGSATTAATSLTVNLAPGPVTGVAVIATTASTVRVRVLVGATVQYDQTKPVVVSGLRQSAVSFLDLPTPASATIEVTIAGAGTFTVGVLTLGTVFDLGVTEISPTIGITDYSKRTTDDYGVTTVVPRGFAKTMSLRTKIATDQVDGTQLRIAALLARPSLWIGETGFDSLAVYGWFKRFSIDLALPLISYCSFDIEGLAA